MNSIEIIVTNTDTSISLNINVKENKVYKDNKEYYINVEKIDKLLRIIRNWDNEYVSDDPKIKETFIINIITNENIDTYRGSGKYPNNYNEFKEWLSVYYE